MLGPGSWEGDFSVEGGVDKGDEGTRESGLLVVVVGVTERIGEVRGGIDVVGEGRDLGVVGSGRGDVGWGVALVGGAA